MRSPKFILWYKLFWMFLKVNVLSTSGPASIGLLYKESVGTIMTESQFVESVGFSHLLPGSEALKLAMFVGFAAGGIPGTLAALLGSILPPTVMMLGVVSVLQRFKGEVWMDGFVRGLSPAIAVVILVVAWDLFRSEKKIPKPVLLFAVLSFLAFLLAAPSPLVLVGAGLLGVLLIR
jgi:chromate transporter